MQSHIAVEGHMLELAPIKKKKGLISLHATFSPVGLVDASDLCLTIALMNPCSHICAPAPGPLVLVMTQWQRVRGRITTVVTRFHPYVR